jgi:hypothetical protein
MPKHIIEFNLPEEREELSITMQAGSFYSAWYTLREYLRSRVKYDENSPETDKILSEVRVKMNEIATQYELKD